MRTHFSVFFTAVNKRSLLITFEKCLYNETLKGNLKYDEKRSIFNCQLRGVIRFIWWRSTVSRMLDISFQTKSVLEAKIKDAKMRVFHLISTWLPEVLMKNSKAHNVYHRCCLCVYLFWIWRILIVSRTCRCYIQQLQVYRFCVESSLAYAWLPDDWDEQTSIGKDWRCRKASSKLEKINQEYIPDFLQMQRFIGVWNGYIIVGLFLGATGSVLSPGRTQKSQDTLKGLTRSKGIIFRNNEKLNKTFTCFEGRLLYFEICYFTWSNYYFICRFQVE